MSFFTHVLPLNTSFKVGWGETIKLESAGFTREEEF